MWYCLVFLGRMIGYYCLVVMGVLLAAMSQILLKKSAMRTHTTFVSEYLNPWVVSGYSLLVLSLGLDIFAMGHGVLPKEVSSLEALSYLFVPMLCGLFFKERISKKKMTAIALIMLGVVVFFL